MAETLISGNDKATLQKLIHSDEIRFVKDEAELCKYRCVSCKSIALYNYTPACKHLYCGKCHGKINGKSCSFNECSAPIGEGTRDKVLDREMAYLEVFCMYNNLGCLEEIALYNFLIHVKKCKFNRRNLLPKLYNENVFAVYKEQTNEEIKKLKDDNGTLYAKIKEIEEQLSNHENGKGIIEEVSKLSLNLKEDLSTVSERFNLVTEAQKKDIESLRSNIREVNKKVADITEKLTDKQKLLDQKLEKMDLTIYEEMPSIKGKLMKCEETIMDLVDNTQMNAHFVNEPASTEFVWKISGIRQILHEWREGIMKEVLSDTFTTNDFGYTMQCKLVYHDTHKSFSIMFHFDPNIPNHAPAVYFHQRSLSIQDQSKFGESHIERIDTPGFGNDQAQEWMSGFHYDSWMIPVEVLSTQLPYVLNDSIIVKIRIDPLAKLYKSVFSKNGTLLWKLDNYKERKRSYIDGVTKFLRSPYFYTHEQGYRVHLAWLHVRNRDISFYLSFNKGEFDDYLPATYAHQATLVILGQPGQEQEDWLHTQKSSNSTTNFIAVIPTIELESGAYLQNDSIVFKVIVE